jgi:hypothetical protein
MSDKEFEDELMPGADEWEEFRYDDADPIGIEEMKRLDLRHLPGAPHIAHFAMCGFRPHRNASRS